MSLHRDLEPIARAITNRLMSALEELGFGVSFHRSPYGSRYIIAWVDGAEAGRFRVSDHPPPRPYEGCIEVYLCEPSCPGSMSWPAAINYFLGRSGRPTPIKIKSWIAAADDEDEPAVAMMIRINPARWIEISAQHNRRGRKRRDEFRAHARCLYNRLEKYRVHLS